MITSHNVILSQRHVKVDKLVRKKSNFSIDEKLIYKLTIMPCKLKTTYIYPMYSLNILYEKHIKSALYIMRS